MADACLLVAAVASPGLDAGGEKEGGSGRTGLGCAGLCGQV
jgi:hypothetical protein